ncbi:MAG: glycosyltransferase [Muribaculum sp.]|nr:glycosyltransferase [Muribaculum sp.]
MKKILFDLSVCQPIGETKFHGGGEYGYIVLEYLIIHFPEKISIFCNLNKYIPQRITNLIKEYGINVYDLNQCNIGSAYSKEQFCKLYSPLYNPEYVKLFKYNIPILVTIHGLRSLEINRDKYEWIYCQNIRDILKSLIKKSFLYSFLIKKYYNEYDAIFKYDNAKIVTVSQHSKASIQNFFPYIQSDKIEVCYSPNTSVQHISSNIEKEKYYVIVSANRWLKNSYRAIKAFETYFKNHEKPNFKVYVIGLDENSKILKKINNLQNYRFFKYIEREELEKIFANAYALVYPSLNEGFGYPPIEVMKYGVPVLASAVTSIPEICGDSVLYFNPYSIDEIVNRIIQIENPDTWRHFNVKSLNRYDFIKSCQERDLKRLANIIIS